MAERLTSVGPWIWTIGLLCFLSSGLAYADCDGLNKRWTETYQPAFKVDVKKRTFECDNTQKDFVIAQAIDDLYEADASHNFYVTARRLIHSVEIAAKGCEERVAAYMSGNHNRLTLCDPFFKLNRVRRSAILFHEASHGRAKDPGHVVCESGEAKDKPTCDASLADNYDGSGHNWEAHLVRFLFQNSPDEDVRKTAKAHMEFLLNNRINGLNEATKKNWLN